MSMSVVMATSMTVVMATMGLLLSLGCNEVEPDRGAREFTVRIVNRSPETSLFMTGTLDTPDTQVQPGPLAPGESYRFDVVVEPGSQLQIITMFLESNDAFLAFAPGGIALWTFDGQPIVGDRTAELVLYDSGTEHGEPLGVGVHQPLRELEDEPGDAEHGSVTVISEATEGPGKDPDGIQYPAVSKFVALDIVHIEDSQFRVVLRNISPADLLGDHGNASDPKPALLSPGVFTVHAPGSRLFELSAPITPQIERLVRRGEIEPLAEQLEFLQGVASDLSAVVWAVHGGDADLCGLGAPASGGLEDLVEDGRPERLLEELAGVLEVDAHGLAQPSTGSPVLEPGEAAELRFTASPGAQLQFVTGYLAANDKFIGACQAVPLFGPAGGPAGAGPAGQFDGVAGDLGWAVELFDAGTEVDEPPGLGESQFERQRRSGSGIDEGELVRAVRGPWMGHDYPPASALVGVEIAVHEVD